MLGIFDRRSVQNRSPPHESRSSITDAYHMRILAWVCFTGCVDSLIARRIHEVIPRIRLDRDKRLSMRCFQFGLQPFLVELRGPFGPLEGIRWALHGSPPGKFRFPFPRLHESTKHPYTRRRPNRRHFEGRTYCYGQQHHCCSGGAGTQSAQRQSRTATQPIDRLHRRQRLRQKLARVRYALRRRTAALCRIAVQLCAPVLGPAAEARCRPLERFVAGDQHSAEVGRA